MTEETIEVRTPRGTMPVHVRRPAVGDAPGSGPLVVLLMDAPGVRPALHLHAERLATAGYVAALPDLFYAVEASERPRPELLQAGDADEFKRMGALAASMRDDAVHGDLAALLARLREPEMDLGAGAWGCVGFCMGGRFALRAAEDFGAELAAAALLHPSRIVTEAPDSPHLALDRVGAALYFAWAECDHVSPPELIAPLEERLMVSGVQYRIELIPEAQHGFTMPGMPAYDERAAERAWAGALALLAQRLPAGG